MKNKRTFMIVALLSILVIIGEIYFFVINANNNGRDINSKEIYRNNEILQKKYSEKEKRIDGDKYKIYPEILTYANINNMGVYKKLYDAVDKLDDMVDVSSYDLSLEEIENLRLALYNRINFELFYIDTIAISEDGKKFLFDYSYTKANIREMKANFNKKVEYILKKVVKPGYTELMKELAVYRYIRENAEYNHNEDGNLDEYNAYSVLVNGKGVCFGYANALHYLLDKLGIESYLVSSEEPAHKWNVVKINNEYYHVDATWETTKGLTQFNMSDSERNKNNEFPQLWYGGNKNFKKLSVPKCNSNRFEFLRNAKISSFDEEYIYYTDKENKVYSIGFNGEKSKKIIDDPINDMSIYGEWIYYTYKNENNLLYKVRKNGKKKTLVDENIGIFQLKIINGELSYKYINKDTGKEVEKKLKIDGDVN